MIEYLQNPYLPERKIQSAFIGDAPQRLFDWIQSNGIRLCQIKRNPALAPGIAGHADIQIFHAGFGTFVFDEKQEHLFSSMLNAEMLKTKLSCKYPNDCKLNFALAGDRVFGNQTCMDPLLEKICKKRGWKRVHVNQGYCKCSTCFISFDSFITDDPSIYQAGIIERMHALLIQKGDVQLNGYQYGFIGGASAKISNDEILFFGDIREHKDYKQIEAFLSKHGCKYKYLPDYPLTDIGGIVPIK